MNNEAQRIAVAKACGWTQIKNVNTMAFGGIWKGYSPQIPIIGHLQHIPDYLNDLNAMHEAEKVLESGAVYILTLVQIVLPDDEHESTSFHCGVAFACAHATAAQRAEAFLRCIGKWQKQTLTPTQSGS